MRKFKQILLAFIAVTVPCLCLGQVAAGTYSFGTFDNKGFDTINVGNLNVMFSIPIINKAGRAGANFTYYLNYNGAIWSPQGASGAQTWTPAANWGWSGQTQALTGYIFEIQQSLVCSGTRQPYTKISGARYIDSSGGTHGFTGTIIAGSCNGTDTDTLDGSYSIDGNYQYNGGKITTRNGAVLSPPINAATGAGTYADSNGNQLSTDGNGNFTDTTGNVVLTITGTNPVVYTYKDTSGASRSVSVAYTNHSLQTAFGCLNQYSNSSVPLVSSISYPDGSAYQFGYDATGRLTSVTLPTGGAITYTYGGISCSDGTTLKLSRTMGSSQWVYDRTLAASETVVTDSLSNQTKYSFIPSTADSTMLFESSRAVYQGTASGTPLLSRATCYNGASCTATSLTVPITQVSFTQSFNGFSLDGSTSYYNKYGLQTERDDYDFGTTTQEGNLLRKEVWAYPSSGIVDLLQSDIVSDGNSNTLSETTYAYDQTTPTASSGVPAHVAVTGQRGNLTSVTQYASSSTSYTTKYTYEDTGSVLTTVSPATSSGATSTLSYDPTFVYNTAVQLPTPSSGVALSYGLSYDQSYTGLPKIQTDPNGQPTTVNAYDSMLRPTEIDRPDGGKTTYSYTPTQISEHDYLNGSTYEDKETLLDGYGRMSRVAISNGQTTNPWYQQDTCYDANGNVNFKSYRYQANGFVSPEVCNGAGDTYTYDALGRVLTIAHGDGTSVQYTYTGRATQVKDENGVSRITQIDGLGRTTAVCEISSNNSMPGSGSSAPCSLDIPNESGFLTNYAYSPNKTTVTQGSQTRVFQTDWLGRSTSVQEPESGTTTYGYSNNTTGLQVIRTRPQANQANPSVTTNTTTQYDALGRPVNISYSDNSASKAYGYDMNCCWPVSPTNIKGRLAGTGTGTGPTWTGSEFSYDAMGRLQQQWFCGPSTCGSASEMVNDSVQYTYDWAGNLTYELTPPGGNVAYARSLAGEVTAISNLSNWGTGNPQSLVSNVVNGPDGPTNYQLGNGLNVVLQYDSMGRLAGRYVCQGSSQPSCTGGSQPYGFAITRSGDRLTWSCDTIVNRCYNYGYDEFDRVTSMTRTQGAPSYDFTYTYDRWGNRWAQTGTEGGPSPSVSFNTSTNQINSSGYTYDAAGNLINDGAHTYTYDADGNITAVDGGSTAKYVYDALNRRVESIVSGVTNEYGYDINGNRVETWAQPVEIANEGRIYWGNMLLAYRSGDGTTYFEHQDWLGNTRLRTDYLGNVAASFTSLPFGDGNSSTINKSAAGQDNTHFGELDLDNETDTDHATFRQYGNIQGRWMSPDPYSGSYDITNPQSMNRYSYVLNNPLAYVDPDGTTMTDCGNNRYCVTPDPVPPPPDPCDGYSCFGNNGPNGGPTGGPSIPSAGGPSGFPSSALPGVPSTPPQVPHTCQQNRILNAVPGSSLTNPNDTVGTSVGEHNQFGINVTTAQLSAAGFTPFNPFGVADGYHNGNVFFQVHDNGSGGQITQGHIDTFNPASGLFGFVGHSIWDVGIGTLLQNLFPQSHGLLDPGC